jgi:hypothetical protein
MLQRLSSLCFRAVVQAKFNFDGWNSGGGGLDGARRVRIISGSCGYLNHRVYANYPRRYGKLEIVWRSEGMSTTGELPVSLPLLDTCS